MPYAETENARIRYERRGNGPAVVLITGFAGTAEFWSKVVPMLSDGFDVIALDNRGCGLTEGRNGLSIDLMADDVIALLDSLGIREAHIVGWSMGTHIAMSVASRYPARTRSLVLVSSYAKRPARASYILSSLADGYSEGRISEDMIGKVFNILLHTEGFFESARKSKRPIREARLPEPREFSEQLMKATTHDARISAEGVQAPTLVVHGMEDIMTPLADGMEVAGYIWNSEFLQIPSEGHILRPQTYVPSMRRFFQAHRSRGILPEARCWEMRNRSSSLLRRSSRPFRTRSDIVDLMILVHGQESSI